MYKLSNTKVLYDWLEHETDSECRELMLGWLAELAEDPVGKGSRVPGIEAQVYLAVTPVRRCTVKYLVAEQFHTINLIEFGSLI